MSFDEGAAERYRAALARAERIEATVWRLEGVELEEATAKLRRAAEEMDLLRRDLSTETTLERLRVSASSDPDRYLEELLEALLGQGRHREAAGRASDEVDRLGLSSRRSPYVARRRATLVAFHNRALYLLERRPGASARPER